MKTTTKMKIKKMKMKTTKKMKRALAVGVSLTLLGASPLSGQEVPAPTLQCESGIIEGSLGISGLDCVGECTLDLRRDGAGDRWDFSTEPRIFSIEEGSPADGVLRPGDLLVAIDGELITTRSGGRSFANLRPGEIVTVQFRRNGSLQEAGIRVTAQCRELALPAAPVGRALPPPPPARPEPVAKPRGVGTAPRVRVAGAAVAAFDSAQGVARVRGVSPPRGIMGPLSRGRLGIGLGCSGCGSRTDEETGEEVWFFSGPIEVTQVNAGGPAEAAGIQMGDLITAIDGYDMATEAGGRAFSTLTPGKAVRMTVVRRSGREETVTLVPGEPSPPPSPVGVARPAIPPRAQPPEPAPDDSGPADLPLSYFGTVGGVEVVVRGGPIMVSEMKGERTIIIQAGGLWIRVRVPAARRSSGGEGSDPRR